MFHGVNAKEKMKAERGVGDVRNNVSLRSGPSFFLAAAYARLEREARVMFHGS